MAPIMPLKPQAATEKLKLKLKALDAAAQSPRPLVKKHPTSQSASLVPRRAEAIGSNIAIRSRCYGSWSSSSSRLPDVVITMTILTARHSQGPERANVSIFGRSYSKAINGAVGLGSGLN